MLHDNPEKINLFNSAVYRSNGEIVDASLHSQSRYLINIPDSEVAAMSPTRRIEGSWLYGGLLKVDFGHFITESLGRLWALEYLGQRVNGIIFVRLNGIPAVIGMQVFTQEIIGKCAKEVSKFPYIGELLGLMCAGHEIIVAETCLNVECLAIPSQLMGLVEGKFIGGHPTYRNALRSQILGNLKKQASGQRSERLYISRSKLRTDESYFFLENILERCLEDEGFTIVYPEKMPISEQLELYNRASHIILATGSAAHALALVATQDISVFLLHRHKGAWPGFGRQLRAMGVTKLLEKDYINGAFSCVDDAMNLRIHPARVIHSLDFDRLWADLLLNGFVKGKRSRSVSSEEFSTEAALTVKALSETYENRGFIFREIT